MKTRKVLREENVLKIDITGRTNVQKDEEQSHKGDVKNTEKGRRSKLR